MNSPDDAETTSLLDLRAAFPAYTGGHYSLVRIVLGLLLFLFMFDLAPHAPAFYSNLLPPDQLPALLRWFPNILNASHHHLWPVMVCLFAGMLSVLLAIGWYDKLAAALIWYILVCLQIQHPVGLGMTMPSVGWLLLLHLLIPGEPYGSFASRGRTDPRGGWYLPMPLALSAWYLLALSYAVAGISHATSAGWRSGMAIGEFLRSPSLVRFEGLAHWAQGIPDSAFAAVAWVILIAELAFPLLILSRRVRPIIWCWTLVVHQALLWSMVFDATSIGMVALHLLCFDPRWIAPRPRRGTAMVRYDGGCGLCHGLVRFLLAEDHRAHFRFAPLEDQQADSLIVETPDGRTLTYSTGVVYVLHGLGGIWAIAGDLLAVVPRPLRDGGYRAVAAVRKRVMRKPATACPIVPDDLRQRFD